MLFSIVIYLLGVGAGFCFLFFLNINLVYCMGFPGNSDGKESACNTGDLSSIPGWVRTPGEGNGNPLQYFCLENSMDRGAWKAKVIGLQKVVHY